MLVSSQGLPRLPAVRLALAAAGLAAVLAAGEARADDVLEETGAPLTISQVLASGLEPLRAPRSLGFTGRAAWVRLQGRADADARQDRLLAWNWPLVERLDLYAPDGRGGWRRFSGGLALPVGARDLTLAVQRHLHVFTLSPGQVLDVYVRVETRGPMLLDGSFRRPHEVISAAAATVVWTGVWLGAMAVLAATALWSYRAHRDRVYLDYAAFGLAFTAYQLLMTGVIPSVAPGLGEATMVLEPVLGALASAAGVRLTRSYLGLPARPSSADQVLRGLGWLALLAAVPALLGQVVLANQLTGVTGSLAFAGCALVALVGAVRGERPARDFLLGFGSFAVAGGWFVAMLRGQLPPSHAAEVLMQAALLASGLAVALVLSAKRRAEEAQLRVSLEAAVADRTRALDATVARLGAAERLEAVGRLTAGVAHDFNNLLTGISAVAGELRQDAPPGSPAALQAEEIQELIRRGGDLTRSLLQVARRQPLRPLPVAVNDLVSDLVRLLERLVKGTVLDLEVDEQVGTLVADRAQLEQVVLNLVLNARDACDGKGRIVVSTARVERAAEPGRPAGPWVRLGVRDDGPGMDEATRARLFEPFFTTKAEGKGTGLGLAVVEGVARAHGGFVEVESAPGLGAAFLVWFPPDGAARQEQGPALTPQPRRALTDGPRSVT